MADNTITDSVAGESGDTTAVAPPQVINGVAVDDQGQALVAPEEPDNNDAAVDTTTEEPQTEEQTAAGADEALPEVDDKLRKYAESNGIELDSPGAIKAAQIAQKAQAEATRNYQKASELEKNAAITQQDLPDEATTQDVENARLRNLELQIAANSWKNANPDKLAYEAAMADIIVNDPQKRQMLQAGWISYDDLYALARVKSGSDESLKAQGATDALESLAHKQQATVPRGNAVSSSPSGEPAITPQNVDSLVAQHDLKWFADHQTEINRAMAG